MAKVQVIYHSDTGNTHALAKLVAEGATAGGAEVEIVPAAEVDLAAVAAADGVAIGSPDYFSYVAGSVKTLFDAILYDDQFKGKPYVGFGTHGGGAKVLGVLEDLAGKCGLKKVADGLLVKGKPTDADTPAAHELGKALAAAAK